MFLSSAAAFHNPFDFSSSDSEYSVELLTSLQVDRVHPPQFRPLSRYFLEQTGQTWLPVVSATVGSYLDIVGSYTCRSFFPFAIDFYQNKSRPVSKLPDLHHRNEPGSQLSTALGVRDVDDHYSFGDSGWIGLRSTR